MPLDGNTPMYPFQNGAIGAPKEEQTADVDAIGKEQPDEDPAARAAANTKKPGMTIAIFMTKIMARLRTVVPMIERVHTRHVLFDLITSINLNNAQQPYDPAIADEFRESLVKAGLEEAYVLDFKTLLNGFEAEAQKRKTHAELAAEAFEEEIRQEDEHWEVVEHSNVEGDWEFV